MTLVCESTVFNLIILKIYCLEKFYFLEKQGGAFVVRNLQNALFWWSNMPFYSFVIKLIFYFVSIDMSLKYLWTTLRPFCLMVNYHEIKQKVKNYEMEVKPLKIIMLPWECSKVPQARHRSQYTGCPKMIVASRSQVFQIFSNLPLPKNTDRSGMANIRPAGHIRPA